MQVAARKSKTNTAIIIVMIIATTAAAKHRILYTLSQTFSLSINAGRVCVCVRSAEEMRKKTAEEIFMKKNNNQLLLFVHCCSYSFVWLYIYTSLTDWLTDYFVPHRRACVFSMPEATVADCSIWQKKKWAHSISRKRKTFLFLFFYRWILINSILAFAWKRYKWSRWIKKNKKINKQTKRTKLI